MKFLTDPVLWFLGAVLIAVMAWSAYGEDGNWFKNTLKICALLVGLAAFALAMAYVFKGPGDSLLGSNN